MTGVQTCALPISKKNSKSPDLREIFNSITYNAEEILSSIIIHTVNKKFNIDFGGSNFTAHVDITTKFWNSFGRCYSIHPKDHVIKLGITRFEIVAHMGIYVYLGYPGQSMQTKSKVSLYFF